MTKQTLQERFQQLAGIKPLYEQDDEDLRLEPEDDEYEDGTEFYDDDLRLEPEDGEEETGKLRAAALLSTDDYKSVYFGDKEDFEEEGFEFIETFNPSSPYTFVMWNNEDLFTSDFDSEEEFIEEFSEMGFGGCDEEECGIDKIIEVINNASADGSNYGLALLANGEEIANGGE
jgi:hypothetical protein